MKFTIVDGPKGCAVVSEDAKDFDVKLKEALYQTGCDKSEVMTKDTDALLLYVYIIKVVSLNGNKETYKVTHPDKERADLELVRFITSLGKLQFIKSLKFELIVME